jgi:glutamate:Na+ symporter, ESS family
MEIMDGALRVGPFLAVTLGIIVWFAGKRLNDAIGFLREFSIPEPVTGGMLFSVLFTVVYAISGISVEFNLAARDILLVYFFTTIGINASLKDLLAGGKPLMLLLVVTIAYMVLQNLTGISVAALFDLPAAVGLLGGTISLIGGHGTAIAGLRTLHGTTGSPTPWRSASRARPSVSSSLASWAVRSQDS